MQSVIKLADEILKAFVAEKEERIEWGQNWTETLTPAERYECEQRHHKDILTEIEQTEESLLKIIPADFAINYKNLRGAWRQKRDLDRSGYETQKAAFEESLERSLLKNDQIDNAMGVIDKLDELNSELQRNFKYAGSGYCKILRTENPAPDDPKKVAMALKILNVTIADSLGLSREEKLMKDGAEIKVSSKNDSMLSFRKIGKPKNLDLDKISEIFHEKIVAEIEQAADPAAWKEVEAKKEKDMHLRLTLIKLHCCLS